MRHLRWKRNFVSGHSCLDRPKQTLYEDLHKLQTEMEHREHCQDMEDLMGDLNAQARKLFELKAGSCEQAVRVINEQATAIAQTLAQQLPLQALDTPACHDCSICDHTGELIGEWLEQNESESAEKNKDVAA